MDLGTGKDLVDYTVDGQFIPYHLLDCCEAGEKYNVFEFQHDFHKAFSEIRNKGKLPILWVSSRHPPKIFSVPITTQGFWPGFCRVSKL